MGCTRGRLHQGSEAELEEVAQEARAAGPALRPEEQRPRGRQRDRVCGLVEGEEEGGVFYKIYPSQHLHEGTWTCDA